MNDYAVPHQRRSKKDLRKKRRQRVYKRGGTFRGMNLKKKGENEENSGQN